MRKLIVSTVVGAFLAFAPAAFPIAITNPSNGDCHEAVTPPTFNGGTVRLFMQPTVVSGASAHLTRGSAGISFTLHTFLPAGDADTVWWVIFNNPSACTDSAGPGLSCGLGDVDPSSPADVSVLNADGLVVGPDGVANFQGSLAVGGAGPGEVLFGSGITNPLGAEIHLLVEDHGAASSDPATLYLQTHNDGGGCPPNSCTLVQDATFPIP